MDINVNKNGKCCEMKLVGRLDTLTAPMLDAELKKLSADITELTYDFTELDYVSSAGLRVILNTQKSMNARGGKLILKGVKADIMEVFEMTGFSDILTFA